MQMKQKYWKMTNRSQDSKEATVILPKRNKKSSRGKHCESWARKTLCSHVSVCLCVWGNVHPVRTPAHPLNCELSESKARFAPISSLTGSQEYTKCSVSAQWRHDYIQEMQRCRIGGRQFRTSPYRTVLFSSRRLLNSLLEGQFHSVTSNCQRLFYTAIHTIKEKKNQMHLFMGWGENMSVQRNWTTSQLHTPKHIPQILTISNREEPLHR